MDNSVDKFPYFFAKTPISDPFLPVKTPNRISFYPCIGSFIASKRSAWQIVAEIFRRNRFFCEIGISALLEKHCSNDVFYRKTACFTDRDGYPRKTGTPRLSTRRAVFLFPLCDKRKRKKRQPVKDFPNGTAPNRRTKPRFPFSFGSAPFLSERRRRRKEKTAPLRGQPKIRMIARYFLSALPSPEARLRRRRIFLPTCALRDRRK